jgi:hypothetical protein
MNDTLEFRWAFDQLRAYCTGPTPFGTQVTDVIRTALDGVWKGVELQSRFVASFSAVGDSLSQWRAYGRPAPGYALGFGPGELLKLALDNHCELVSCIYDPIEQTRAIESVIEAALAVSDDAVGPSSTQRMELMANRVVKGLLQVAARLKHPSFEDEQEWRITSKSIPSTASCISFRAGRSMVVPYIQLRFPEAPAPIPLKVLVVGPSPSPQIGILMAFDAAAAFGSDLELSNVRPSQVPYRDW